jgi:catechol 2,3-dioxygenase-like lactoylglutathione lyase family enzyme
MSIKDSNVTIMVKNMDTSVAFYQSIGFNIKQRWDNQYAQLTAPGITLGIHLTNDNISNSGNVSIGFTTDNFEESKDQLNSLAIQTQLREEEGGKFIHFSDPDGTALYFIKPKWG